MSEPLGIAYIAAYLESQGITVQIIDAQAENLSVDDVVGKILQHKDALIGISVLTPVFVAAQKLCSALRTTNFEGLIILGGAHCSALAERILKEIPKADVVGIGEGALIMADIAINRDQLDNVKGICL